MKIINLDLISLPEIEGEFFFLDLVSKLEIKCQKVLVSSRYARLNRKNSHSRLEVEKVTLVELCPIVSTLEKRRNLRVLTGHSKAYGLY